MPMIESIVDVLNKIGLKENEVRVYLTCLENKQGLFIYEITSLTKLKRSSVNLILDRLIQKGFLTHHFDGSRKKFSAESPESLVFQLEESTKDLRGLIPLLRFVSGNNKKTKIRFFEGKEGVEKIYADTLLTIRVQKTKSELLAISSGEDVFQASPTHQKQFIDKRIKEQIPIRWIAPESKISRELDKTSSKEFRKMKFFDSKKYQFHIEIDVYADSIAIISLSKEPSGVIIEDKILSESFRSLFNLLWNSLK
jgi:sugar-specific transcriptional regulator TrmB